MAAGKDITRRTALEMMAAAGASAALPIWPPGTRPALPIAGSAAQVAAPPAGPLQVFTAAENALVVALSEHIIPADAHSPGAAAAGVSAFIDRVLAISPAAIVGEWREGLQAVDRKSVELSGTPFLQTTPAQQIALLTEISRNERTPATVAERFFCRVKYATIDAYYTSKIGLEQELRVTGSSTHLDEFTGCTHPEHQ